LAEENINFQIDITGNIDQVLNQLNEDMEHVESVAKFKVNNIEDWLANLRQNTAGTEAEVNKKISEARNELRKVENEARSSASRIKTIIIRSYAVINQMVNFAGIQIPPVLNASVRALFTIWEQYIVLKTTESTAAAGPFQQWRLITVALAIISAGISLATAIKQQTEANNTKRELNQLKNRARGFQQPRGTARVGIVI
jgi:hypothetical protein